jgi:hypothetical protein
LTAINQHNRRLTGTVEELLTPDTWALLDTLLRQENADEAAAGSNAAYKLTLMKKLSQSNAAHPRGRGGAYFPGQPSVGRIFVALPPGISLNIGDDSPHCRYRSKGGT